VSNFFFHFAWKGDSTCRLALIQVLSLRRSFVTFEKEDSVEMVMKLEHEIMGKYVETKRAEPRDNNR